MRGYVWSFLWSYYRCVRMSGPSTLLDPLLRLLRCMSMPWAFVHKWLKPSKVWGMTVIEWSCMKLLRQMHTNLAVRTSGGTRSSVSSISWWNQWHFICSLFLHNQFWDANPSSCVAEFFEEFVLNTFQLTVEYSLEACILCESHSFKRLHKELQQ